jgi:OOP family OmpA-OmpF porin
MNKFAILSATLASALVIGSAAQAATPGAYAGAGLGYSRLETPNYFKDVPNNAFVFTSDKRGGIGGRVFAGYNFNKYFGVEGAYTHFASSKNTISVTSVGNVKLTNSLVAASIVGKAYLPVEQNVNLYALGGLARVSSTLEGKSTFTNAGKTVTRKYRPVYGVGVSYDVNSQVTTSLEFSRIEGSGNLKTSEKAIPNADLISFNVSYNFG